MTKRKPTLKHYWIATTLTAQAVWQSWRLSRKYGVPFQTMLDAQVEVVQAELDELTRELIAEQAKLN